MKAYFDKLYCKSAAEFNRFINNNLKNNIKTFIVTANPETLMIGKKDAEFSKLLLDENTIVVPDGIGIVKAAKILKHNVIERIPGIDIVSNLLKSGNKFKKTIYIFGATEEVINLIKKKIKEEYPKLKLVGAQNGYVNNRNLVFEDILKQKPDLIFIALGIPSQEKLIYKHIKKLNKGIFVGVGGSFDVLSGVKKRAPKIYIKLNLEWLYRLIKEPNRISRFYNSNVKFMCYVIKNRRKML